MSNSQAYFSQRRWQQQEQPPRSDRHHPSVIELGSFKRYLEELNAYVELYRETWIMPYGIGMPMNQLDVSSRQILEHIQVQQSESADRSDGA